MIALASQATGALVRSHDFPRTTLMTTMTRAVDIAAYVLRLRGPMDAMKLQKLVYYAQAWSLALRGKALFAEPIQAWAFGPVTYSLFDRHRGKFVVADIGDAQPDSLTSEQQRLVDAVVSHYGRLDGAELSELTHAEEPWREARQGVPEGSRSQQTIDPGTMARFYSQQTPPFSW